MVSNTTPIVQGCRSMIYYQADRLTLYHGDSAEMLRQIPSNSVHTAITSPPYFCQCDYKILGQIGLETTIEAFLERVCEVFREVYRVLVPGGVFWVIIADTSNNYSPVRGKGERRSDTWTMRRPMQAGFQEKESLQIPHLLVDAMRRDGWLFRRELIWDKGTSGQQANSDTAALTHESILQFGKWTDSDRPYLNCKPLRSSVLRYSPKSDKVHPCPFPLGLARELLEASMQPGETILDPFCGSGTSLAIGQQIGKAIGIDLNTDFLNRCIERLDDVPLLAAIPSLQHEQVTLF